MGDVYMVNGKILSGLPNHAKDIIFDNDGTDFSSTNTEDAIKEVNSNLSNLIVKINYTNAPLTNLGGNGVLNISADIPAGKIPVAFYLDTPYGYFCEFWKGTDANHTQYVAFYHWTSMSILQYTETVTGTLICI